MMHLRIAVAAVVFLLHPIAAASQPNWSVTAFTGVSLWTDTGLLDLDDESGAAAPVFGVAIERALNDVVAVEADVEVLPRFMRSGDADSLIESSRLVVTSASLVGRLRDGQRLQPRASLGIASVRFNARDRLGVLDANNTFLGVTASGGVIAQLRDRLAARVDVRYLRTQRDSTAAIFDDGYIDMLQATIGMTYRW